MARETGDAELGTGGLARTALRRLRPPVALRVTLCDGRVHSFLLAAEAKRFHVTRTYGPWRSSGEWWGERAWSADSRDVAARAEDGTEMMCLLTHDLLSGSWQMDGLYD